MIMISSDSCLLLSLLFPLFFTRAFPILERGFASYLLTRKAESALCRLSPSYKFLSPPSLLHHISTDSIVRMSGETRALDGFYEALYTERTECKVSRRFRDENAQKVLPPRVFSLASKQVVNIHFLDSDLNFDLSLLSRKINHEEEEEEEASDQRRSKVEDVEEKETKRKERNAEEIARRKQGAETVTETETAATSGYPLSASSIVVITRKRKLRGSETVGKVVKVGWGGGG